MGGNAGLGGFGDIRRAREGAALLSAVQCKRTLCVRRLADDRKQERRFSDFLANPAVSTHEMLVTAGRRTNQRGKGRHLLAVTDTTDVLFPTHEASKRGFGMGSDGEHPGLFLHPILAVDATSGGIVGLVDCIVMNRTEGRVSVAKTATKKKVKTHKKRTADDKESHRWLQGAETAGDCLTEADMITMVCDREGDIFHLLANRPANVHLLVRSNQPRTLVEGGLLPDYCSSLPERARQTIDVPAKGNHPGRKATVALRFGPVTLKRPANSPDKDQAKTVSLWVVDVREVDPPRGVEAVNWRLMTTHEVTTVEQARQIVIWYRMRWIIEQVFRSMKSDCLRIEDSQLEDVNCFRKLAMIGLIAAIRAMQLVMARDGSTGQPVTDAADPAEMPALRALSARLEGRTEKLKNPHDESLLAWYAWIVARLGGWSGYTSHGYRPPGPKTMHHGLLRLDPTLAGWRLAERSGDVMLQ
jgi:Transposase DDE domain